jgi:hypothetical protein
MRRPGTDWGGRLAGLDRRWIYLILASALVLTLMTGLRLPERPSVLVEPLYQRVENLPAGSPILLSLDYTPSTAPELEPMAFAVVRHALLKGHRLCFVSLYPEGDNQIARVTEGVIAPEFPAVRAGRDYAVLGYKAGNEMVINALAQRLDSMYAGDLDGRPLVELPALAGVHSLADFALVVAFSAGTPGLKEWILFAGDPLGVPLGGGCNGAGAPQFLPYFPHQLLGLMGGIKGAAEYEAALRLGHPEFHQRTMRATEGMGPQAVAHCVIIAFVLLGNLGLLLGRRRAENAK